MKSKNRSLILLITAAAVYLILLRLLVAVESASSDATIHDLGDAFWYSIITMTTVGYGDLAPVTAGGRVLGLIFALCSIGLLAMLIGLGLRLVGRRLIPYLRLSRARSRRWYWFSENNEEAGVLARAIRREQPDSVLIFPAEGAPQGLRAVCAEAGPEELLRLRKSAEGLVCFFMGREKWDNYAPAVRTAGLGIRTCCMTEHTADPLPELLQLFSPSEVMSRSYWKEHPLQKSESCLVLIGCGEAGEALLERALLTNVYERDRRIEYHVFGETGHFASLHPAIVQDLAPGSSEGDQLFLHEGSWRNEPGLMSRADRIVFCAEEDRENLRNAEDLRRWFPVRGSVQLRLTEKLPGMCCFGAREDCFTPEFVLKDAVNRRAVRIHEIYNESARTPVAWKDLGEALRQSNIAAADHLIVKARMLLQDETLTELTAETCRRAYERFLAGEPLSRETCREIEHRRWMRFQRMYNWQYAPVRDNDRRCHPQLLPFEQLSEEEQRKDDHAWEMLGRTGGR